MIVCLNLLSFSLIIVSKISEEVQLASGKRKSKPLALSMAKKVELLKRPNKGTRVRRLREEYGIGTSTIYDFF